MANAEGLSAAPEHPTWEVHDTREDMDLVHVLAHLTLAYLKKGTRLRGLNLQFETWDATAIWLLFDYTSGKQVKFRLHPVHKGHTT